VVKKVEGQELRQLTASYFPTGHHIMTELLVDVEQTIHQFNR